MPVADCMINFFFADDPNKHVCEVQIVHQQLLTARKGLPGHIIYGRVRNATELLENMCNAHIRLRSNLVFKTESLPWVLAWQVHEHRRRGHPNHELHDRVGLCWTTVNLCTGVQHSPALRRRFRTAGGVEL